MITVKKLIEKLEQMDPEAKVFTSFNDDPEYVVTTPLKLNEVKKKKTLEGDNLVDDGEDYGIKFDDNDDQIKGNYVVIDLTYQKDYM
jgi:hypothetical protein